MLTQPIQPDIIWGSNTPFFMRYLTLLLVLPSLVACGAQQTTKSLEPLPPPYCVESIEVYEEEGYAMLDLKSRWNNDKPIKISLEYYLESYAPGVERTIPNCTTND